MRGDGPLGLPAAEPTHLEQLCSRRVLGWLERRQVLIEQRRTQRLPVAEPSCAEPCSRTATAAPVPPHARSNGSCALRSLRHSDGVRMRTAAQSGELGAHSIPKRLRRRAAARIGRSIGRSVQLCVAAHLELVLDRRPTVAEHLHSADTLTAYAVALIVHRMYAHVPACGVRDHPCLCVHLSADAERERREVTTAVSRPPAQGQDAASVA
jgi:hypothetical protein